MIPMSTSEDCWIAPILLRLWRGWAILSATAALAALPARANVYPTSVKINAGFTDAIVAAGNSVNISYILNERASAGVTIKVLAGGVAVRTISLAAGNAGTLRGTNTIVWDGKGDDSNPVALGTYTVTITASSQGYPVWTQTSNDSADGNNVWLGRGIAVDQNTNSAFYGRVFVSNAQANPAGLSSWLGWQEVGILKCNADGSYAEEGGLGTGGYPWAGDGYSPWRVEVSREDFVYVNDFTTNGQVIRWDPTLSTNSELPVLRPDNWANLDVDLSGPAVSGTGTNTVLWMADTPLTSGQIGLGILRYALVPDGTCASNDVGTTAVAVGGSLTSNPQDVALDAAGNIYTIQFRSEPGDPENRVFRFPAYGANSSGPISQADWSVGAGDDTMAGASGIAVDPSGTYVAVAFTGLSTFANGCTQIFYATNGAVVTNLDLGVTIGDMSNHEDWDCAWDAVGNVYYIDNDSSVWRTVSPPGANQSTTMALAAIQVVDSVALVPPQITQISVAGATVTIAFSAGSNDTASAFSVVGASTVAGPYVAVAGATVTSIGPGQFRATFSTNGTDQYFRIARQGGTPALAQPSFTSINASAQNVVLMFAGSSTDLASSFTLLSAEAVSGPYSPAAGAIITQMSPGTFQAVVPNSGSAQFYRLKK